MSSRSYLSACLIIALIVWTNPVAAQTAPKKTPVSHTRFVSPFIGSEGHGHVFVGANVPFGGMQLGPTQIGQTWDKFNGWDWCSGYNYISKEILGFTHTHLSGTGIGDLNDVMLVPANGVLQLTPAPFNDMKSGYGSFFSKSTEKCSPGYYEVYLDKYKVKAQLTASERVGLHQYTYGKTENAHLLIDLGFHMNWDMPTQTSFAQLNDSTFTGYRFSTGWAKDQRLYFAIRLSVPASHVELFDSTSRVDGSRVLGKYAKAALFFDAAKYPVIKVKVGISPVSEKNALANVDAEMPGWDFNHYRNTADAKWNRALDKINFESDDSSKVIFYTSLYHSLFGTTIFNDNNGDYRGTDKKVYAHQPFTNYTTMSLWDTYRGWHPLMTIIEPEKVKDIVMSMLAIYRQQGYLPVWPLMGNETNCMVGYPAIAVITDAYLKKLLPASMIPLAYEAVRRTAMRDTLGLSFVKRLSYIPRDSLGESVAWGLEYAIADAGIARMAGQLGYKDDALYFSKRSALYKQYFDEENHFFVGKKANGQWRRPFDPVDAKHTESDYTEGNAWQYLWLVPQDVTGLMKLLGGAGPFRAKLDTFFSMSSDLGPGVPPDISGMVGQYAQGNEPSHHIAYLYNYVGQPWKTADHVREIMGRFYTTLPDGLCGNEDVGQMSAWYVLSALGFYSVDPTAGVYVFGTPMMQSASIQLPQNKTFTINVIGYGANNKYIQRMEWNGRPYGKSYFLHRDLAKGGVLKIYMGNTPSQTFGTAMQDYPGDFLNR